MPLALPLKIKNTVFKSKSPPAGCKCNCILFHVQIGSYYGSEVCGLDVDQDGITDVLLVAAPMFLGSGNKEAGRVYIYSLSGVNSTKLLINTLESL